ncbi:MAG: porin, partial [Pseudomonadota bacterium]
MKSVIFTKLAVLTATTALINSAYASELVGSYPIGVIADDDFDDIDIRFTDSITLDNGLTFGGRIDLEDEVPADAGGQAFTIRGSFGTVRLGEDDDVSGSRFSSNFYPNSGIQGGPWGGCGEFEPSPSGVKYVTPRFAGISANLNYLGSVDEVDQDGLPIEQGGELAVGYGIGYELDGLAYGASVDWCLDVGRILPWQVSLGFEGYELDGSGSVSNLSLPNVGIPGVGDSNGVFLNTPVDLRS